VEIARSNNAELAYSVEGSGDETVLLVMGLGGRAADWGTAFPGALAERYRVVRYDNRGVGKSPKAALGYSLSDLAGDAVVVLDAVGAAKAHVVGISMGGMIAQLVALEHPERVGKLVLMSTHMGGPNIEQMHPDAQALFDPSLFLKNDAEATMRRTLGVITAPGWVESNAAPLQELLDQAKREPTHATVFMAQLHALMNSDRSERLRDIVAPTLVVHGCDDKLIRPSNGRELATRIPGAQLAMLENCGHMPMYEKTNELSSIVLEFLAR
jgi:3-oxoadipate enol-lactonase